MLAVLFLMAIGFIIKHWKVLDKVENTLIPPVLLVFSFVIEFVQNGFSIEAALTAVVSCAVAIGLHQQGKNIFVTGFEKIKETIWPKLTEIFKGFAAVFKNNKTE